MSLSLSDWNNGKTVEVGKPVITGQTPVNSYLEHQLQLRSAIANIYPIFITINSVVFLLAIPLNSWIIIKIITAKEARNSRLLHFLANAAVCDLFKLIFVLPITLVNLLLQNFVFGAVLCYALPMLQVFPIHASILTYAGLTFDRFREIRSPDKKAAPAFVYTGAAWIIALCSILPYSNSVAYVDLEPLRGEQYQNLGICFFYLQENVESYMRATFFLLFLMLSLAMMYLLMRTSWELNFQRKVTSTCVCDDDCMMPGRNVNNRAVEALPLDFEYSRHSRQNSNRKCRQPLVYQVSNQSHGPDYWDEGYVSAVTTTRPRSYSQNSDGKSITGVNCNFCTTETQWKDQQRITIIITLFILSWTPINIFNLAIHFLSDPQTDTLDILNLLLSWLGFLSTCFNPFIIYLILRDRTQVCRTCYGNGPDPPPPPAPPCSHSRSKSTIRSTRSSRTASPLPATRQSSYTPSDSYRPSSSQV